MTRRTGYRDGLGAVRAAWFEASRNLAEKVEHFRARYVYKVMDAALTARLGAPLHAGASDPRVRHRGSPSYRKARRVTNRMTALLPGPITRFLMRGFNPGRLPFRTDQVQLLSFGSGSTVFLLGRGADGGRQLVLKIWRRSLGRSLGTLRSQARARRRIYETIARWYGEADVVLPSHFMVVHGPVLAGAAVACVQPFVGRTLDLFQDFEEGELVRMLFDHPRLRRQFQLFAERTLHFADAEGACVDLLGRGNVVLDRDDGLRIRLLDYGIFDFEVKAKRHPDAVVEIRERLEYLERIQDALREDPGRRSGLEAGA